MPETRPLIDYYHYWTNESINIHLDKKRHNFSVFCCNVAYDFNIATVVRNANAFLARDIIVYGNRKWDRRAAVGSYHYMRISYMPTFEEAKEFFSNTDEIEFVAVDYISDAESVYDFSWSTDKHTVLVVGQEHIGIEDRILELCNRSVYIPQFGTVRSLNVGTASGIMMNEYCRTMSSFPSTIKF